MAEDSKTITPEEIEMLDILFGYKRVWIETDDDYRKLGGITDEDE